MFKIRDQGMIYIYQYTTEWSCHIAKVNFIHFAYAKFRKNKTLEKISKFTL